METGIDVSSFPYGDHRYHTGIRHKSIPVTIRGSRYGNHQTFARKMQQQQQRRQPRCSRSHSQIQRRNKKGTLVMRGGNDDKESEVATDGEGAAPCRPCWAN